MFFYNKTERIASDSQADMYARNLKKRNFKL